MKNHLFLLIFFLSTCYCTSTKAQYILKQADEQYNLYNYDKAIELYTVAYQSKNTLYSAERLAECYRLLRDFKQAESWYAIVVAMPKAKPENFKWFAEMLRSNGNYVEAKKQFNNYAKALNLSTTQTDLVRLWEKSCDSALNLIKSPLNFAIINETKLNSDKSDWGAVNYLQGVVFTSNRSRKRPEIQEKKPVLNFDLTNLPKKDIDNNTGNSYFDMYYKASALDSVISFPIEAGSDYHLGPASFNRQGTEMFFALTRIPKVVERKKNAPSTINIEIFSSVKINGKWDKPKPFRYNNIGYWSVGDPFLSEDGSTLYFVSNMPENNKGGTDIYYCKRDVNGDWGDANNLAALNTSGNERTPSACGNYIYFASDGHISLGGLDIFRAEMIKGNTEKIINMGYPINSAQDDFAFFSTGDRTGYFSSNRLGGIGSDDIYSFVDQQQYMVKLNGKATDKDTGLPLAHAIVSIKSKGVVVLKTETDENGLYAVDLPENANYDIIFDKPNYGSIITSIKVNPKEFATSLANNASMEVIKLGKEIELENIYYAFGKAKISAESEKELEKLVQSMKVNPAISVELSSYTDSRGNYKYNLLLSQKRAEAAATYIINRGIDKRRIVAKGYGEKKLLNHCKDGVPCSEEEHQLNRRTTFTILKK